MVEVSENDNITTGSALLQLYKFTDKYDGILSKIIQIKQEFPEQQNNFRKQVSSDFLLENLRDILLELKQQAQQLEKRLQEKQDGA